MKRDVETNMQAWKHRQTRKPLVLMGARQVGKTWLMRSFAKQNFAHVHEFNFDDEPNLARIFEDTKDPYRILPNLASIGGHAIDIEKDVVIFDEVQSCPNALNSLKYFHEKCPQLAVMSAGSLLGVRLKKNNSGSEVASNAYPVGKVELLDVEPMSFSEFLCAHNSALYDYYCKIDGCEPIPEVFHSRLLDALGHYLVVGGMPECVSEFCESGDVSRVRKIQRDLVSLYEDDVLKYNGKIDAAKTLLVMRALVPQLAKRNEKFIYGTLRDGARARDYEGAIEWLVSARVVRRVCNANALKYPLSAYESRNAFKLYHLDVGLLREMAGISPESIILDMPFEFKGPFMENYVLQQLHGFGDTSIKYYSERAGNEIDFVGQKGEYVVPMEVKAGSDKTSASFKTFVNTESPRFAVRFSRRNLRRDGGFTNIPLYLAPRLEACL